MPDSHQRIFPCPIGCVTNPPREKEVYLEFSYEHNGKEIWWCAHCKEHFVREDNGFHHLLKTSEYIDEP
ncbi:MAG: hypothetical protein Q7R73_00440 [bacterium]|nr:hypothetical protein [bacterium]